MKKLFMASLPVATGIVVAVFAISIVNAAVTGLRES